MRSRNRWLAYTIGQSGMSGRAMTKLCARRISGCSSDVGSTCTAPGQLLCRGELLQPAHIHHGLHTRATMQNLTVKQVEEKLYLGRRIVTELCMYCQPRHAQYNGDKCRDIHKWVRPRWGDAGMHYY